MSVQTAACPAMVVEVPFQFELAVTTVTATETAALAVIQVVAPPSTVTFVTVRAASAGAHEATSAAKPPRAVAQDPANPVSWLVRRAALLA